MDYPYESLGPFLHGLSLVFLLLFCLLGIAAFVGLADLPGQIAQRRGHPQAQAVRVCGWLGLPTFFFWVVA